MTPKSRVSVSTLVAVCPWGPFFKKVATRNSCLSQAFRVSGSAGVWAVMTGLTGRKTECGSTVPSVSALYDAVCE